jgi:hypothetical protein
MVLKSTVSLSPLSQIQCMHVDASLVDDGSKENKKKYLKSCAITRHEVAWAYRRYSSYSFSTSALDGVWVVSVTPRPRFVPGERTPGTHCTGGWVGLRAGLDREVRGNVLLPLPGIEPQSPGRPALYWLSYAAHHNKYILKDIIRWEKGTYCQRWQAT